MTLKRLTSIDALYRLTALFLLVGLVSVLSACNSWPHAGADNVSFSVDSSHDEVYVGETVTVWAETSNVIGEKPEIKWSTTGGDLENRKNNSVAQVTFDKPGTYEVAGRLQMDNGVDRMDRVIVRVSQLP